MSGIKASYISNKVDEVKVEELCNRLNIVSRDILYMNPDFIYYGSKDYGYYTVINNNRRYKKKEFHLDFRLYYPDKRGYYYDGKAMGLDGEKFEAYVDARYRESEFLYGYVQWMSVQPCGKGYGSRIVSELLCLLKEVCEVEFVLLHPIDKDANDFWVKNGFVEEGVSSKVDKRVKTDASRRLIYKFD